MPLALAFGLRREGAIPEGLTALWGARWIYPNDQLWDRQDFPGMDTEEGQKLKAWLDGGAITKAMDRAKHVLPNREEDRTAILYEDAIGIIKGNPQASHGYLYVAGYLRTEQEPYEPIEITVRENCRIYYRATIEGKAPKDATATHYTVYDKEENATYHVNEPTYWDKSTSRTRLFKTSSEGKERTMTLKQRDRIMLILKHKGYSPRIIG